MADPTSFFFANAEPGSPLSYDALQTRRKIAEQLMGKRSPFPKTFGEGLTYAGERFADVMDMNRLDAAEKQQAAYEKNVLSGGPPLPGTENTAVAPAGPPAASRPVSDAGTDTTAPVQTAAAAPYSAPGAAPGNIPLPPPRPARLRDTQLAELQADPALMRRAAAMTLGEVDRGTSPVERQTQFASALDRAGARGIPVAQALETYTGPGSRGYYPPDAFARGERLLQKPGAMEAFERDIATPVLRGADPGAAALGFTPTGNASGGVAQRGVASGRYNVAGSFPGSAETYVQQESPAQLARLEAGRNRIASAAIPDGGTAPVQTAALTTPGVASDAGPASAIADSASTAIAALPTQQSSPAQTPPLVPGSGPPITTDIKPMPVAQAAPGTIPPSQAGMALPVPPKPRDPGPQPVMPPPTPEMLRMRDIANNRMLSPDTRAQYQRQFDDLRKGQHDVFINDLKAHHEDVRKLNDPATGIALTEATYKAEAEKRKLEGEGFFQLTPEELSRLGKIPEGVTVYKDRLGNLKTIHGPQTVSIDMAGEKAEAQGIGKHTAERHGKMMESANTAGNSLYTLNRAEALLNKIDTNALAPASLTVGAFGRALGIPDEALASLNLKPEQIGSRQAFNAIVGDLVIGKIGAGGFPSNNFSNTDRTFLTDTVAKLGDDPESNRIKLASAKLVARRDLEKAQDWSAFRNAPENKGKSFVDFEDHWNAKINKLDVTGELQKQAATVIAAAGANVPPEAINMLRANPASAEKFDKVFGIGASKRYLGQ